MAKSLDSLIDFLLGEIALSGEQGVSCRDVIDYTTQFYAQSYSSPTISSPSKQISLVTVDRRFIAKVWQWLSRHDDLSVGHEREFNSLTFQQLEAQFPGIIDASLSSTPLTRALDYTDQDGLDPLQNAASTSCSDGPRIRVSLERIYRAICGHGPDPTRVFPMEYALLCAIASTRHNGILQGELGRSTGQDKRSVPKRTDALQAKGYIVKRTVWTGGHKTSRLILRRFADQTNSSSTQDGSNYTLRDLGLQIFATLKEKSFTTQDDLAVVLSMTDPARQRVLSQVIRFLVQRQCLKKVRVAKGPVSGSNDLKICIQILREPVDFDWQKHQEDILDLATPVDDALAAARTELNNVDTDIVEADADDDADVRAQSLPEPSSSTRPSWNPDRLLPNMLHDLANVAGEDGITNLTARRNITGFPVRRPVESLLVRISHASLKAQPAQIRDLSLVRSLEVKDSISRFVHRTLGTYQSLVQQGQADWSALTGAMEVARQLDSAQNGDLIGGLEKDEFGFVKGSTAKAQIQYDQANLDNVASMTKAASLSVKPNEPILVNGTDGNAKLAWQAEETNDGRSSRSETPKPPKPPKPQLSTSRQTTRKVASLRGARRKFTKGTEKFWPQMFLAKMLQENPSYPKMGAPGMMKDPGCQKMFQNRPSDLDAMVVKTLEHNLPVPLSPTTVSQAWIDRMNRFFTRTSPGVYFAPSGAKNLSRTQLSCVVVIRSDRLNMVDFSDRGSPASVFFLVSSAAHIHPYYRNDGWVTAWQHKEASHLTGQEVVTSTKQTPRPRTNRSSRQTPGPDSTSISQPLLTPEPSTENGIMNQAIIQRRPAPPRGTFAEPSPLARLPANTTQADTESRRQSSTRNVTSIKDSDVAVLKPDSASKTLRSAQHRDERGGANAEPLHSPPPKTQLANNPVVVWESLEGRTPHIDPTNSATQGVPTSPRKHTSSATTDAETVRKQPLQGQHIHTHPVSPPFRANSDQGHSPSTKLESASTEAPSRLAESCGRSEPAHKDHSSLPVSTLLGPLHPELSFTPDAQNGRSVTGSESLAQGVMLSASPPQPNSGSHVASLTAVKPSEVADGSVPDKGGPQTSAEQQQDEGTLNAMMSTMIPAPPPLLEDATAINGSDAPKSAFAAISEELPATNRRTCSPTKTSCEEPLCYPTADSEHRSAIPSFGMSPSENRPQAKASQSPPAQILEGKDATKYYQRFILELINMCGGVLPHGPGGPPMLKRAMKAKSIEAGVDSNPNIKQIKSSINQLVQRGSAKLMHFAFQKNGFNHTKTILALPKIQLTDGPLLAMQGKIRSMPVEDDYVPPEVEAEADRKPLGFVSRYLDSDSDNPTTSAPRRKKRQPQTRQRQESSALPTARGLSISPPAPEPSPSAGFLTLKVPKIGMIQTQNTFTTKYFALPAEPLRFHTDANLVASQTAEPTLASQRRSGIRIPRNTKFNSQTRKIQWRVPKTTPLPKSLRAILSQDKRTDAGAVSEDHAAETSFERAVDFVAVWEQRKYEDLQEQKPGMWNFINHLMQNKEFPRVPREAELQFRLIEFQGDQDDAADHEEIETEMTEAISWDVFAQISATMKAKQKKATAATEKRKRKLNDIDDADGDREESDFSASEADEPRAKRARRQPKTTSISKKRKAGTENDARQRKRTRLQPRGIGMRHLPQDLAHRLGIVFALVKVLAGGLERYLDFKLVARLVPEESESVLRERWKVLSTRYNNDVDALIQDVQIKYLDALADDRVPSVNFEDIQSTNWEEILAWANANVNTKDKDLFREIPPTREELLTLNTVEVPEPPPLRNLYNISLNYTQGSKEEALCSAILGTVPSVLPQPNGDHIIPQFSQETDEKNLALARARSWVLAAILTPEQKFKAIDAHQKLLKLAEDSNSVDRLLEITMKKLQTDRVVIEKKNGESVTLPDGSTLSGTHGWKVCNKYFDKFDSNRIITPHMLRIAARYKFEVLDPSFARGETVLLPKEPDMEDGEMMAIFNLVSMGMLEIKPGLDVPASRYGLDWEDQGYKTKSMDKNILSFSTILEPTPEYAEGDPLSVIRMQQSIPKGGIEQLDDLGLIPAWIDIHHGFQPYMWEMIVGAVIGIISARPGVSSIEIVRSVGWVLSQYDLDLVLQFLLDCTLIQKVCNGWETTEWWWLALGSGYNAGVKWKTW